MVPLIAAFFAFSLGEPTQGRLPKVGERFHVTGCERGKLVVPVVRLWSQPGGLAAGARPVGQVSGEGRADQGLECQGSVVIAREVRTVGGRTFVKVETVVGSQVGWITDSFVGRRFERSQCAEFFRSDQGAAKRCASG